jgi:hypothetical protein
VIVSQGTLHRLRFHPMKLIFAVCFTAALLSSAFAQQPAAKAPGEIPVPAELESAFSILKRSYPKVDAKKHPQSPADSVWLFRAASGSTGTVEVGFQNNRVVYMVFRRGIGAAGWTAREVEALHRRYSEELLKESRVGENYARFPAVDGSTHNLSRLRYGDGRIGSKGGASTPNNSAIIARKDFDVSVLKAGL